LFICRVVKEKDRQQTTPENSGIALLLDTNKATNKMSLPIGSLRPAFLMGEEIQNLASTFGNQNAYGV
jgi:hypothetical protein